MQLGTFGAVFEAAIQLEESLARRYEAQAGAQIGAAQQVYRDLAGDGARRLKLLERLRREMVTEMILEPIQGLSLGADLATLVETAPSAPLTPTDALRLEQSACAFYEAAADRIGLAEAARALRKLGQGSARRAQQAQAVCPT